VALKPPCPICGQEAGLAIVELRFGDKANLPSAVTLHGCADCDFAFSWPRDPVGYRDYYAAVANDTVQRHGQYRNLPQAEILADLITSRPIRTVLDFGCGGGGLLHVLAERFPEVQFLGFDVNAGFPSDLPNLSFTNRPPATTHDLVILSHVLEHIPDIAEIAGLFELVAGQGLIHIEVPDPKRYAALAQPHFAYYVDRLHINHFSQRAILKIAPRGFEVAAGGVYDMPYSLGETYPARYVVLRNAGGQAVPEAVGTYLRQETAKAAEVRARLRTQRFFIYGFGDNFHRNLAPGGPLAGLEGKVIAVIDRNAEALSAAGDARFRFVDPTAAEIDGQPIVCTVSQFSDLGDFFRQTYPRSEVIYL
jgi:SAM-dependent methyltransferase